MQYSNQGVNFLSNLFEHYRRETEMFLQQVYNRQFASKLNVIMMINIMQLQILLRSHILPLIFSFFHSLTLYCPQSDREKWATNEFANDSRFTLLQYCSRTQAKRSNSIKLTPAEYTHCEMDGRL